MIHQVLRPGDMARRRAAVRRGLSGLSEPFAHPSGNAHPYKNPRGVPAASPCPWWSLFVGMGDTPGETVPCHYCGVDIEVPAERSRFEAFTAHFETEHIRNRVVTPGEGRAAEGHGGPARTVEGSRDGRD